MNALTRITAACVLLACTACIAAFSRGPDSTVAPGSPAAPDAHTPADINDLAWMAGCWEMVNSSRVVEEQWMAPRGGMMVGMSRTVRNGRAAEFEATRIEQRGDTVIFFAQPSGQPAAAFPAKVVTRKEVVFENLAHDFPQRVIYRIAGDSLLARIEGVTEGKKLEIPFPMVRTSCPGNRASATGVGSE